MNAGKKVFIVVHHEIMQRGSEFRDDEMVFWVVSSFAKAIDRIKKSGVESYSWWEIQEQRIDQTDWPVSLGFFGRRGGKLKYSPYESAVAVYKKCKADPKHHLSA